jgi:hypothetical protein
MRVHDHVDGADGADDDVDRLWLPDLEKFHKNICALEIDFIRSALPTESPRDRIKMLAAYGYAHAHVLYRLGHGKRGEAAWNGF